MKLFKRKVSPVISPGRPKIKMDEDTRIDFEFDLLHGDLQHLSFSLIAKKYNVSKSYCYKEYKKLINSKNRS